MKLLFIVNEPWFFISHRLPIALAAKEQGYAVHVATKAGEAVSEISKLGFVHHVIPLSRSGIAVRQKWMFAPMLIFLLISLIGKEKKSVIAPTPAVPLPRSARFK